MNGALANLAGGPEQNNGCSVTSVEDRCTCFPGHVASQGRNLYRLIVKLSSGKQPSIREVGSRLQELGFRGEMLTQALQRAQCSNSKCDGTSSTDTMPRCPAIHAYNSSFCS